MKEELTLDDLSTLAESVDVECKAAQGRDGNGELPDDFWKSYSAMANGDGGVIWLGIQEKPRGAFHAVGLANVERVRKALWDNLHNSKQINVDLLSERQVQPVTVEGKTVLRVEVPRAARQSKPVHVGSNPFGGTYLRRHEVDYQADEESVRRMLTEPEQTLMELRMTSLLPAQAVAELEAHLGARFAGLSTLERLALVTAATEGVLNHGRLREISMDHPTDISKMLARLVKEGLLVTHGIGRGMMYYLPWQDRQEASLFGSEGETSVISKPGEKPPEPGEKPPELGEKPPELPASYLDWSQLDLTLQQELARLALPVSQGKRATPALLRETILDLCAGRYLGRRVLAQLLNRNPDDLFKRILTPLVEEKRLKQAFPSRSDPRQAYMTNPDAGEE